jgi:hypothetical protein
MSHKLVLLESEDGWVWAYFNGKRFHSHHTLDSDGGFDTLMSFLDVEVRTQYIDSADAPQEIAALGITLTPEEIEDSEELTFNDEKLDAIATAVKEKMSKDGQPT